MKFLTKQQQESYENSKIAFICKNQQENKYLKNNKYLKVRDHCNYTGEHRGPAKNICNLKYKMSKKLL